MRYQYTPQKDDLIEIERLKEIIRVKKNREDILKEL